MRRRILFKYLNLFIIVFFFSFSIICKGESVYWAMVVDAHDIWTYMRAESSAPPANWNMLSFDDCDWTSAQGGIGYGDNDDNTIISPCISLFIRNKFNIADTSVFSSGILYVDYDDSFIAYLNGVEIARANIDNKGDSVKYDTWADNPREALGVNVVPEKFIVTQETIRTLLKDGENILALEIHNYGTSSDMSSTTYFALKSHSDQGDYPSLPDWFYYFKEMKCDLPLLIIDTESPYLNDEEKIMGSMRVINNVTSGGNCFYDTTSGYEGRIGIKIRGRSSQMFPKKSFSLELRDRMGDDLDYPLLGLPEESDWILYAPYSDKTMLRNVLTYQLGAKLGGWHPRTLFCEVFLNGDYHGVYVLTERIKRNKNRVDISKLKTDEISGDDLTGGYIVKVDNKADNPELESFNLNTSVPNSMYRKQTFTYVYPKPEDIVVEQKDYINKYLTDFENSLNGDEFTDVYYGYEKYLNVISFIDLQMINELSNNVDGYIFSTYFYKEKESKGGKLSAGPLWDYNLGYGNVNYSELSLSVEGWAYERSYVMYWWRRMMQDERYVKLFYERWHTMRQTCLSKDSICTFLETKATELEGAVSRNYKRWPTIGKEVWPNYFVGNSYAEELDFLVGWIEDRANWMDANIPAVGTQEVCKSLKRSIRVFPNPAGDYITMSVPFQIAETLKVEFFDVAGHLVLVSSQSSTEKIDVGELAPGCYLIKVNSNEIEYDAIKLIKVDR